MEYQEIDSTGELVCLRSGSNHDLIAQSVAAGNSLLTNAVPAPAAPSWWNGSAWIEKPGQPSTHHKWDRSAKVWTDPRTPKQIAADGLASVRAARNAALAESDAMALRALDALLPADLRAYRQALRDLPAQPGVSLASMPSPPPMLE